MPVNPSLRRVKPEDKELILSWANDPEVRRSSFDSNVISPAQHQMWFSEKFGSPDTLMFIFENQRKPTGLVRLEKDKDRVELSYLIAPRERGKGLASKMLDMAISQKRKIWGSREVFASIVDDNIASKKALLAAGFSPVEKFEDKETFAIR
jgi:UDP-2,4-diacetamido-2,4,6-trideoxy-beta-L-altropyranose hydrolase